MTQQWRAGALAGPTPDKAFYVNIGLGETMTAQDILEGSMIVEIGMAGGETCRIHRIEVLAQNARGLIIYQTKIIKIKCLQHIHYQSLASK